MSTPTPKQELTVDLDAVRDIINDIRNGEHYSWGDEWDQSNAELLESLLREMEAKR